MLVKNIMVTLVVLIAAVLFFADYAAASIGGPISPDKAAPTERARDLGKIERAVMSEKVSARLSALGYDSKAVVEKISLMSDSELAYAAENLESVQSGGDVIFELLFLAFLVIFIIWLLDYVRLYRYYH